MSKVLDLQAQGPEFNHLIPRVHVEEKKRRKRRKKKKNNYYYY